MKPTPKTDKCIELLDNVEKIFWRSIRKITSRYDWTCGCLKDIFLEDIFFARSVLLQKCIVENETKKTYPSAKTAKAIFLRLGKKKSIFEPYFEKVWNEITELDSITLQDLKKEFWEFCPQIDDIPKHLKAMQFKYGDVLKKVPKTEKYTLPYAEKAGWFQQIRHLNNEAIISDEETNDILFYLTDIAKLLEDKIKVIAETYKSFMDIVNDTQATKTIPSILISEKASFYFHKAIKEGLMNEKYEWIKGLQLLSCFAQKMSDSLNLGKGTNSNGTKRITWKPFEELFNIKPGKLRSNFNDIQKTGCYPSDIDIVNKIFK